MTFGLKMDALGSPKLARLAISCVLCRSAFPTTHLYILVIGVLRELALRGFRGYPTSGFWCLGFVSATSSGPPVCKPHGPLVHC